MTTAAPTRFDGFPRQALAFLHELSRNNNRDWFWPRRHEYGRLLLEPARALVVESAPLLRRRLSPGLRAEPREGGSILRVRHDARFIRDPPYRTELEVWFWEGEGPSRLNPGFFVRVGPDRLTLGAGLRAFTAERLERYRRSVDDPLTGVRLAALLRRLQRGGWRVGGEALRRPPAGYLPGHERAALLRHTGLWAECAEEPPAALFGEDLPAYLVARFRTLRDLHAWLVALA